MNIISILTTQPISINLALWNFHFYDWWTSHGQNNIHGWGHTFNCYTETLQRR